MSRWRLYTVATHRPGIPRVGLLKTHTDHSHPFTCIQQSPTTSRTTTCKRGGRGAESCSRSIIRAHAPMLGAFSPPFPLPLSRSQRASQRCGACQRVQTMRSEQDGGSKDAPKRRRRAMSAEARAKISAALKGRRKSDEHRENLRRRFGGDQNPMYGRKLSAESRAKISRAMIARKQKKEDGEKKGGLDKAVIDGLREKAESSRLMESTKEGRKRPGRRLIDEQEAKEIDEILERVARLDVPPESVVRTIRSNERKREVRMSEMEEGDKDDEEQLEGREKCGGCDGSGMVACPECVGAFGVASGRCETCFGAGVTFCAACEGAGSIESE